MQDDVVPEEYDCLTLYLEYARVYKPCYIAKLCLPSCNLLWVDVRPLDHAEQQLCDTRGITTNTHCFD